MNKHRIEISQDNEDCELFREIYKKLKHLHKHNVSLCFKRCCVFIIIHDLDYWIKWDLALCYEKYMVIDNKPNLITREIMSESGFIRTIKGLLKF